MKYRVETAPADGKAMPTVSVFDEPHEAAELLLSLIMLDSSVPRNTSFRLITALLRGDDTFTVLAHSNHYTIQRVP